MIRPATPADARAIAEVHERALEWAEQPPEPLPRGDTLVAEIDGEVYGFVTTTEDGEAVFVDPRAQGAGLGTRLLEAARAR
ncbi:MAG TPA: GNAT family N-acetyltransferase [Solirubrobacteraceae bacterium]